MKKIKILILLFLNIISINIMLAQTKGFSDFESSSILQSDKADKASLESLNKLEAYPTANAVNPDFYYLGPGDILMLQNLTSILEQQPLKVTLENTILIPRIGAISIAGKTLSETKKMILDIYKERNPNMIINVSLYQPRTVIITISGNVLYPGTYTYPASYLVSTVLQLVNNTKPSANSSLPNQNDMMFQQQNKMNDEQMNTTGTGSPEYLPYYTRNIVVEHNDGKSSNVDIESPKTPDNIGLDPYIREGDKIFVPFNRNSFPSISISGEVRHPIAIPFKKGDKASTLIKLCKGFTNEADLKDIKLYMYNNSNATNLNVDNELNVANDCELSANSFIIVGKQKELESIKTGFITVSGCVNKSGIYVIETNKTRLKDAIEMAGGLTPDAYLPLSYIIRPEKKLTLLTNSRMEFFKRFQYSDLSLDDTARFSMDALFRKPIVSCDFSSAIRNNSDTSNIYLQDGDVIVIPSKPKSVFVWGQVNQPGFVNFSDNKTMDWYIQRAGGYATGSVKNKTRIIRGKNLVWVDADKDTQVYAGDEIYIPHPSYEPPGTDLQKWSLIVSVLGTTATLLNVIIWSFFK